jgi:ribonuclease P protein component
MDSDLPDQPRPPSPKTSGPGRLTKRAEFQRAARGRRKSVEAFTLQAARRGEADPAVTARVGFTVTRKVGNAVVRNRIRRRLKAAIVAASPLEAEADHDYVLMARREALSRAFRALTEDLRQAFRAIQRGDKDGRRPHGPKPVKDTAAGNQAAKDRAAKDRRT